MSTIRTAGPLISIAICSSSDTVSLQKLIAECTAQIFTDFEILLGSHSLTSPVTALGYHQDSRIRHCLVPINLSAAEQATMLAERAHGTFVWFPTSAARYAPTALQEIAALLGALNQDIEVLYAPLDKASSLDSWTDLAAEAGCYEGRPEYIHLLTCDQTQPLSPIVIRKSAFARYGSFHPDFTHRLTQEYALRILVQHGQIRGFSCPSIELQPITQPLVNPTTVLEHYAEKMRFYSLYTQKAHLAYFHGYEGRLGELLHQEHQSLIETLGFPPQLELALHYAKLRAQLVGYGEYHDVPLMSGQPKISVILITQGLCLSKLARALDSLQAQSEQNFELICIQTQGPSLHDWLKPFQAHLRLTYVRCPKPLLPSIARKMAFTYAAGHYLAYLDERAAYEPNHLELLRQRIEKAGVDFVLSNGNIAIEKQDAQGRYTTLDTWEGAYTTRFDQMTLTISPSVALSTVMHRTTLVRECDLLDIGLEVLDEWFYLLTLMSGRNSQALVNENTVTLYEELGFQHSPLKLNGLAQFIQEYDRTCLHLQTFGKHDTEQREHYRLKLEELHANWGTTIQTLEGFRRALNTMIGGAGLLNALTPSS